MKRPMRKVTKTSLMPNGHRIEEERGQVPVQCQHAQFVTTPIGQTLRCPQRAVWCVYRRGGGTIAFDYYCDVHWTTPGADGKTPKQHAETRP
jgi:hypothetical protein